MSERDIRAYRGYSEDPVTSVQIRGVETTTTHYLTDGEVTDLIATLQASRVPHWTFSRQNGWQCSWCRREVESEERPEPCGCYGEAIRVAPPLEEIRGQLRVLRAVALSMPAPKLGEWNWPEIASGAEVLLKKLGEEEA